MLGAIMQACNPINWDAQGRRVVVNFKAKLAYIMYQGTILKI